MLPTTTSRRKQRIWPRSGAKKVARRETSGLANAAIARWRRAQNLRRGRSSWPLSYLRASPTRRHHAFVFQTFHVWLPSSRRFAARTSSRRSAAMQITHTWLVTAGNTQKVIRALSKLATEWAERRGFPTRCDCSSSCTSQPVEPKPPLPRSVAARSSTQTAVGVRIFSRISWQVLVCAGSSIVSSLVL